MAISGSAVQNVSTAGVAGYVGGYLLKLYDTAMSAGGFYVHRTVDIIPADSLVLGEDVRTGLAAALGGYVLHRLFKSAMEASDGEAVAAPPKPTLAAPVS